MWRRIVLYKINDVSEERTASIFEDEEYAKQASHKKQETKRANFYLAVRRHI
jgi:hypothetical protein